MRISVFCVFFGFISAVVLRAQVSDPKGLQDLLRLVESEDVLERLEAVETIAEIGPAAAAATPVLLCALDQDIKLRWSLRNEHFSSAIISALVAIGPTVIPAIIRELEHDPYAPFGVLSNGKPCPNPDAEARRAGAIELGADDDRALLEIFLRSVLHRFGSEALPNFIEALERPGYHRVVLIETIGMLGSDGRAAAPVLVTMLHDRNTDVRCSAARSLAQIGAGTSEVIAALRLLLEDRNPYVREVAADALESLQKE